MRKLVGRSRRRPAVWVTSSSWPSTSSTAISRHAARTDRGVLATSRPASLSARSDTRVATLSPKSASSPRPCPRRCRSAATTCSVGSPRREAERSITSSWMSAKRCSSSRAAATRTSCGWVSCRPPATAQPQWASTGRSRLPWLRARSASSPTRSTSSPPGSCPVRLRSASMPPPSPVSSAAWRSASDSSTNVVSSSASASRSVPSTDRARRRASRSTEVTSALIDLTASFPRPVGPGSDRAPDLVARA